MAHKLSISIALAVASVWLSACVKAPMGPKVRVATATASQLQSLENEDSVWYEFQPGDIVPVEFGFLGAVEGGAEKPSVLRAKKLFYFVTQKNGPIQLSFDGKTLAGQKANQSVIAVVPRRDGKGGQLLWIHYMGQDGDPDAALETLVEESQQEKTATK